MELLPHAVIGSLFIYLLAFCVHCHFSEPRVNDGSVGSCHFSVPYDNSDHHKNATHQITLDASFVFITPTILSVKFDSILITNQNNNETSLPRSMVYLLSQPFEIQTDINGQLLWKRFGAHEIEESIQVKSQILRDVWFSVDFPFFLQMCYCPNLFFPSNSTTPSLPIGRPLFEKFDFCDNQVDQLELPDYLDWRVRGYVTEAKSQDACRCCWDFALTGLLEFQYHLEGNVLTPLSEQSVIDCNQNLVSGCDRMLPEKSNVEAGFVAINANGIFFLADYLWVGRDQGCQKEGEFGVFRGRGFFCEKVEINNAKHALQTSVLTATMYVNQRGSEWFDYNGTFVLSLDCDEHRGVKPNHAVLLVGYGRNEENKEFFIVKNSYGDTWGQNGFGMLSTTFMERGCLNNLCRIGQ